MKIFGIAGVTRITVVTEAGRAFEEYRYGDSNPGFRRERAAS